MGAEHMGVNLGGLNIRMARPGFRRAFGYFLDKATGLEGPAYR